MGTIVYKMSRWGLRRLFWLTGGLEVRHQDERVPKEGPLIVAANHASYWDPMILGATFNRTLHFMARKTLFDIPGFAWLIRANQAFPLNREGDSREAIRAFGELLDKDQAVVMFPEGTRTPDGKLQPAKTGVGMLAVRNQAPVLPLYIWGSFMSWPRGQKWPRPHRLKAIIGDPIYPSGDKEARKTEQARITEAWDQAIHQLEAEAWQGEGPPPSQPWP